MAKFSAIVAAALAATASALPTENKPRACGVFDAPDYLASVQKFPDSWATGTPGTHVSLGQSYSGGSLVGAYSQVVTFNGPIGAYGCQIGLNFPEDITKFYAATGLDGAANPPTMNIYRIDYPVNEDHTAYADLKKNQGLFGTATVRPGNQIINSFSCPTASERGVAFLLEIPEWIHQSTLAAWTNSINYSDITSSVGLYVNYNC
jgi:hypothetical protein